MKFYTTDFASITCNIPNTFDANDITRAAEAINELGCLAYPLILAQTGLESYEVSENAFYYYAVAKAIELGGSHEMVNSMVAEDARYTRASQTTKATLTPTQAIEIVKRQTHAPAPSAPTPTAPAPIEVGEVIEITPALTAKITPLQSMIEAIATNNRNRLRGIMFQIVTL